MLFSALPEIDGRQVDAIIEGEIAHALQPGARIVDFAQLGAAVEGRPADGSDQRRQADAENGRAAVEREGFDLCQAGVESDDTQVFAPVEGALAQVARTAHAVRLFQLDVAVEGVIRDALDFAVELHVRDFAHIGQELLRFVILTHCHSRHIVHSGLCPFVSDDPVARIDDAVFVRIGEQRGV